MRRVLTTMSDGEAHTSHLAAQTLASMVVASRAACLDRSGLQPWIQSILMALPIESSKLFAGKVQEAKLWDTEEDKVGQRKAFLKPSSSGYYKQQTSAKGKGPAAENSSASATQAKQSKPKPPPQASKDSGSFKRGGGSSHQGSRRGGWS